MGATSEHGVTRRVFLGGLAALPLAVPLDGKTRTAAAPRRVAVVGAGAFGGWTALHLRRLGAEVVLVDAWGAGNARSSSGGESRVIRSIYGPDRVYAEMVKRSFELWREIDTSDDDPLYVETGALWMHRGNDDYVRSALPIVTELGFPVDELSVPEAKRRYPQIDLTGVRSLFLERRAGALLAQRVRQGGRDIPDGARRAWRSR
jgi:glycine/D-amino acid oxidase-like deaminating enzyme